MITKKCCAFGHRIIFENIRGKTESIVKDLIEKYGINLFYTGGMGEFDNMFSSVVRTIKKQYSNINLVLVKPYFTQDLNKNKIYYDTNYDSVIIPTQLADVYYKSAIKQRNQWIIDNSDIVITYVQKNYGGAYEAEKYAKKKDKKIIRLTDN